jgi:RNA polymerase sigma-70 factor (ECF subfamily)
MSDLAWIDVAIGAARPQAMGALLRYFRNLDAAEEAFQEACLRALKNWPQNGPPRDADRLADHGRPQQRHRRRRRASRHDRPAGRGRDQRPGGRRGRGWPSASTAPTIATTCCACCSSAAIRTCPTPSRSRWPCASSRASRSGRSPGPSWSARRRWSSGSPAPRPRSPRPASPSRRPARPSAPSASTAVAAMLYLVFNEGYSAGSKEAQARAPLCDEAIRLARLLLRLFPAEPEIMGLTALMLLQHSRADARFDDAGEIVLAGRSGPQPLESRDDRRGLAMIDKALRHRSPGPTRSRPPSPPCTPAPPARRTPTGRGSTALCRAEQIMQPSPVVTLNRAVAVSKIAGPQAALAMVEPLGDRLDGYFYFHGLRGHLLHRTRPQARRRAGLRPRHRPGRLRRRGRLHPPIPGPRRGRGGACWF